MAKIHRLFLPSTGFQYVIMLFNEVLKAKMLLKFEIVHNISRAKLLAMKNDRLGGHELHQPLAEITDKPLLEQRHHQAAARRQLFMMTATVRCRSGVQHLHGFCYGRRHIRVLVGERGKETSKLGISLDKRYDMLRIKTKLIIRQLWKKK